MIKPQPQKGALPAALQIPLGDVIKAWRQVRGLSVTQLAQQAGVTKGYISLLEHNRIAQPKPEYLAKLAAALDISVWDLVARQLPSASSAKPPKSRRTKAALAADVQMAQGKTTQEQLAELRQDVQELRRVVLERLARIERLLGKKRGEI